MKKDFERRNRTMKKQKEKKKGDFDRSTQCGTGIIGDLLLRLSGRFVCTCFDGNRPHVRGIYRLAMRLHVEGPGRVFRREGQGGRAGQLGADRRRFLLGRGCSPVRFPCSSTTACSWSAPSGFWFRHSFSARSFQPVRERPGDLRLPPASP